MNPDFLERIIRTAPGIHDCGVVPTRDTSGHGVAALIVLRADFDQQRFLQFCSRSIERRYLPSRVIVVKQLPRDRSSQLDRAALLRLFEQCVSEDSRDVAALLRQAGERERAGQLDEAIACYRAAVERNPSDFLSLHHIGRLLLMQGRAQEAKDVLDEAIRYYPQSAELLTNRGRSEEHTSELQSHVNL